MPCSLGLSKKNTTFTASSNRFSRGQLWCTAPPRKIFALPIFSKTAGSKPYMRIAVLVLLTCTTAVRRSSVTPCTLLRSLTSSWYVKEACPSSSSRRKCMHFK